MTDLLDFLDVADGGTGLATALDRAWTGAPLAYTVDYFDPDDLLAAFDRWCAEHGRFGCIPRSHMWHRGFTSATGATDDGHTFHMLLADTRCTEDDHDHAPLPGHLMHQAICASCRWHHISPSERDAVEAWHDHAFPGWRDLPILPGNLRWDDDTKVRAWIDQNYPAGWHRDGVPIRTHRAANSSRPVENRSPFGGFDIGHVTPP
jgi:hypothetical protein